MPDEYCGYCRDRKDGFGGSYAPPCPIHEPALAAYVAENPKQEHESGDVSLGVTGAPQPADSVLLDVAVEALRKLSEPAHVASTQTSALATLQFIETQRASVRPVPQPAAQQGEPFGYFRAEPFGWTGCAEGDEGAVALYEKAGATDATLHKIIASVEAALDAAGAPAGTLVERIGALVAAGAAKVSDSTTPQAFEPDDWVIGVAGVVVKLSAWEPGAQRARVFFRKRTQEEER